ncbi:pyridoxal-phosphate dependent enzyme [Kutzneria viridogrisea]|uniref:Threonine dehydratase n=1 Tax=Kutzneria viridogrisea TaxID=47990 RepID=A0ABR6BFY9_9PSEU|nr:threonine dehydratase [Kutzneria viridogrisea]
MAEIAVSRIERAVDVIDPVFLRSPLVSDDQLSAALGREVLVKVETVNPIRSFKGRGADYFVSGLAAGQRVVCASAGNFGQAMAYAGRRRGVQVRVYTALSANPAKVARMQTLGAEIVQVGADFDVAKDAARELSRQDPSWVFVEDGHEPAVAEGAGTIGLELLAATELDAVVLPVGNGALITGVGRLLKERSPSTKVVGVCARGAVAMLEAWRTGRVEPTTSVDTIADGIAVRVPVPNAVRWMREVVDEVVAVPDSALVDAMRLAADTLGLVLEPSGAAGLAAIAEHDLPAGRIATVLTGSNVSPGLVRLAA